ncbi:MAG TPA: NADPH-dependent glutamate synthase [bacterium]|nr:NADPH-dependent glutamate synthase [bacterium]HPJ71638.1 NADPH-dependent glutamate synthase [bacterium]HPQ65256.1 NADPH-dependent glutamate synthase [bacterium]
MAELPAAERKKHFREVPLGYSPEEAGREAARCLQCPKAPCRQGCPVEIDIPGFIRRIREGDDAGGIALIRETNSLPAVCGRVCPQEEQCEKFCVLGKKGEPVAVGALERYLADREEAPRRTADGGSFSSSFRVAVVGSGPAGLTAAGDLARLGYGVTVFEALHAPGGVMGYGIPAFRLPREILDREIERLKNRGVRLELNTVIGAGSSLDDLFRAGFSAVFIGSGAGLPRFMNIPGENLNGVYSANEYLTRVNLMGAARFPETGTPVLRGHDVGVVGGGNVAMDSARTALRLGAERVSVIYRRSREELPARRDEIGHAEEEGVRFLFLTLPTRYLGDERGRVREVECLRMELGEPDSSGRRRPIPIPGSEFVLPCDLAVVAVGNDPNPLVPRLTPGLETGPRGTITIDPETGKTSLPGVFAGGDIASGAATVIEAMGAGKRAARAIDDFLRARR